jgi:hypothetical protein
LAELRPVLALAALFAASCGGPKALTLPTDPVDRAATCGIVAAAEARLTSDVKEALPFAAQGRILHHALLAASEGGEFKAETANAVSRRMSELQEDVTKGKWKDLAPACAEAYPLVTKTAVELPAGRFEAQIACEELADFLTSALAEQEVSYGNELAPYSRLRRELNDAIGPGLRSRAGPSLQAQQVERRKALAAATQLGAPVAVMEQCVSRFARPS